MHLQERIFATDIYEIAFIYLWRSISLNNSVGRETVQLNLLFFISALMWFCLQALKVHLGVFFIWLEKLSRQGHIYTNKRTHSRAYTHKHNTHSQTLSHTRRIRYLSGSVFTELLVALPQVLVDAF